LAVNGGEEHVSEAAMHRQQAGGKYGRECGGVLLYVFVGPAGARFGRYSSTLAGGVAGAHGMCLPGATQAMS